MAELKPFEVIMRIDYAASKGPEVVVHAERVQELVRCKECKYHLPETERTNPYCNRFHCMKPDDWFCADGERKVQDGQ